MSTSGFTGTYRPAAPAGGVCTGVVLRRLGITRARLRYLVAQGIVEPVVVGHGAKRWNCYTPEHIDFLREVLRLQEVGYTLRAAVEKAKLVSVLPELEPNAIASAHTSSISPSEVDPFAVDDPPVPPEATCGFCAQNSARNREVRHAFRTASSRSGVDHPPLNAKPYAGLPSSTTASGGLDLRSEHAPKRAPSRSAGRSARTGMARSGSADEGNYL